MAGGSDERLLREWECIMQDLRHFGSKRFAQLTVFVVAVGALFTGATHPDASAPMRGGLGILGFLLSLSFFHMERSTCEYVRQWLDRARAVEAELGLALISRHLPEQDRRWRRATTWTFLLYVASMVAWAALAVGTAVALATGHAEWRLPLFQE